MDTHERNRLERLLAIVSIGLCVALKEKLITVDEAEGLLFSPSTMRLLGRAGAKENVIGLIHGGTELENIERLLPDRLIAAMEGIMREAQEVMLSTVPVDANLDNWVERLL